MCVLGAVAGAAVCGAWQGTTPLVLVAALALLVAGFDAVEPLAQEVDHPTRRDLLPVLPKQLIRRHLVAPTVLMLGVLLVAVVTALLIARASLVIEVGAVIALPTAVLVLCGVALSATNDPYAYMLNPTFGYVQTALPFALATWRWFRCLGRGRPSCTATRRSAPRSRRGSWSRWPQSPRSGGSGGESGRGSR